MPVIEIKSGKIETIRPGPGCRISLEDGSEIISADAFCLPGFVDIHCHGAFGHDVNSSDLEGFLEIGRFLASKGVTSWLPTIVPDSYESYGRIIGVIDALMEKQSSMPVAQALGVHYEGIFANEHMCGALHTDYFRTYKGLQSLADLPVPQKGVRMMTFAPEIVGGIELAADLSENGWVGSIGHTRADPGCLKRAFDAGAKHMTHFFNAMTGIHHRDLGVAGFGLSNPDLTFDIIADGKHVHPAMLKMAVDIKGVRGVSLISDSIAPAGHGDGEYEVWGERISISEGYTSNSKGTIAGSVISSLDAFKMMRSLGFSVEDVSMMASGNPARLLSVNREIGSLEAGSRADVILMDKNCDIEAVIIRGMKV